LPLSGQRRRPRPNSCRNSTALGGPQRQQGVDGGDVEPFVETVDREEDGQVAGLDALEGVSRAKDWVPRAAPSLRPVTPVALNTWRQYI
jgi:hypothetical protein